METRSMRMTIHGNKYENDNGWKQKYENDNGWKQEV